MIISEEINACEAGNNNPNIKRLIQTRGMEEGGEGRTGDTLISQIRKYEAHYWDNYEEQRDFPLWRHILRTLLSFSSAVNIITGEDQTSFDVLMTLFSCKWIRQVCQN